MKLGLYFLSFGDNAIKKPDVARNTSSEVIGQVFKQSPDLGDCFQKTKAKTNSEIITQTVTSSQFTNQLPAWFTFDLLYQCFFCAMRD